MFFGSNSSSAVFTIESGRDWQVSVADQWLTIEPSSGTASKEPQIVTVTATANSSFARQSTLTVQAGNKSRQIAIGQSNGLTGARLTLPASVSTGIDFEAIGGQSNFDVESNVEWSCTCDVEWVECTYQYLGQSTPATISIEPNTYPRARMAHLTFAAPGVDPTIVEVRQSAYDSGQTIALGRTQMEFDASGKITDSRITLYALGQWSASTGENSWIHLSQSTGTASRTTIEISVDANTDATDRTGKVVFDCNGYNVEATIVQSGTSQSATISADLTSLTFLPLGESMLRTFTITSTRDWTATASDGWFTVWPQSGPRGTHTLTVQATANESAAERYGKVNIKSAQQSLDINVEQSLGQKIGISTQADFNQFMSGSIDGFASALGIITLYCDVTTSEMFDSFNGKFDGNGHTLTWTPAYLTAGTDNAPFREVSGSISNLNVKVSIDFAAVETGATYVAGIVGSLSGGTIDACTTSGTMRVMLDQIPDNKQPHVGGIAGSATASSTISNCINNIDIVTNALRTGGIVGNSKAYLIGCTNNGDITCTNALFPPLKGKATEVRTGGISGASIGDGYSATLYNSSIVRSCTNNGKVSGYGNTGGIVGVFAHGALADDCTNSGAVIDLNSAQNGKYFGAIIGDLFKEGSASAKSGPAGYSGAAGSEFAQGCGRIQDCINTGTVKGKTPTHLYGGRSDLNVTY